jgi:hypothetical protein
MLHDLFEYPENKLSPEISDISDFPSMTCGDRIESRHGQRPPRRLSAEILEEFKYLNRSPNKFLVREQHIRQQRSKKLHKEIFHLTEELVARRRGKNMLLHGFVYIFFLLNDFRLLHHLSKAQLLRERLPS